MDEILFLLLQKGAHKQPVRTTTTQIGTDLEMSQQNASYRLLCLEKDGYIERTGGSIKLTQRAMDELASIYVILKSSFEGRSIELRGKITTGLGEGSYYLGLSGYRNQFQQKLEFDPFQGTLNLSIDMQDLWKRQSLLQIDPIVITGFKDGSRTYGDIFAYHAKILEDGALYDCAIIVPLRTHHPQNLIEVIAPFNIREKFRKGDGETVKLII